MTLNPPIGAEPFAAGREADVFALDETRVLRRYRHGGDVTAEAEVMAYAAGRGFPAPAVHDASGPDLVLERLYGPTMAEAGLAGELSIADAATILADLLRRLHSLPARNGGAGTIVHLDLHPENVMLTDRGPVLIDWRNARDGEGDLDTAMTALILAQVAIGSIEHPLGASAGEILDRFLAAAPGDPIRLLDDAVTLRSGYGTLSRAEIGMLGTAAARVRNGI